MDTTTAATQAGVTRATIRHWARMGAIAATKTAGRWTIDETSLARRIRLTREAPVDTTPRYRCGHEVQPTRRTPEPTSKSRDCRPCKDARAAAAREAVELPDLAGTPKQVGWATTIRSQWIENALTTDHTGDIILAEGMGYATTDLGTWTDPAEAGAAVTQMIATRTATWWIQYRGNVAAALRANA